MYISITRKVLDYQYDIGVKDQGQIHVYTMRLKCSNFYLIFKMQVGMNACWYELEVKQNV